MSDYTLPIAFDDLSRATLATGEPLDCERRHIGAALLHTIVRAGHDSGLPQDISLWPVSPAEFVAAVMTRAGELPSLYRHRGHGHASSWALREAAAEFRACDDHAIGVGARDSIDPDGVADGLDEWADGMYDLLGGELPEDPDELAEYDAELGTSR